MADYQRVIEFLRDVRQGAGSGGLQTVTEEIGHMAAEYAALCAAANDRLRKCSGFLQQGLRTEAIHLAEESPNLLDLVSQLDLPDPQAWAEFCQNNGFPVPPALQLERAAQLNEAYAQDQPMEHLLARHRLLALSRAPVRERLDVMRKLAQMDAGNATWEKDIRIFEQARLKELPSVFYNAVKNHDNHAIAGLMEELNQHPWFEPPPADLIAAVTEAYGRVQRQGAEAELRKLVEPLREAFAARSLQECQALVQRWKNAMAAAGVAHVSADLMDEIRPVVAFVGDQTKRDDYVKRFHESCKTFRKMLDADAPDGQLEAGYAKLKEFHEEIPEDLTRRYMNKRSGRRKDADRRHKLRLATIAGMFAAVIVIGLVVAFLLSRATAADKWARQITGAIAAHTRQGLDDAQKFADKVQAENPALAREPKVAGAIKSLETAQAQYAGDAANIKTATAKVEAARAAAVALGAGAAMEEVRAAAGGLDAAINEAGETLKTAEWADPEGKLRGAIAGAQALHRDMQDRVLNVAGAELKALSAALAAVPEAPSTPAAAVQAQNQLRELADRAARLAALPLLDAGTKSTVQALLDQIARRRQGASASGNVAEELQNIRTLTGSAAEVRAALANFISRFPADPRTADFKAALDRLPAAAALETWQARIAAFTGGLAPANGADAQKRADDITAFLTAHPEFPRTAEALQYVDYLKRAVDALGDKGPWQTALEPLLGNLLLKDLAYLEISDGRRFYTLGDPLRKEQRLNAQISVSFETLNLKPDADNKVDYTKKVRVTFDPPLKVADAPVPAPHTKAVADLAEGLKTLSDANWDTFGIDQADRLAHNDQMDIVVKAILLQQVLKTQAAVAGGMIGDAYDRTIDALSRQKPDELPWPDPAKISGGTRNAIKTAVDNMPAAAAVKQRLAAARAALFKSVTLDQMSTGVLLKDDTGTWVVHSRATPVSGATVWAIVLGPAPAAPAPASAPATDTAPATAAAPQLPPATLVTIGTASGGRFVLDSAALRTLPQGSIVFVTH